MQRHPSIHSKLSACLLTATVLTSSGVVVHGVDESEPIHPAAIVEEVVPEVVDAAALSGAAGEGVQIPLDPGEGIGLVTAEGPMTIDVPEGEGEPQIVVADDGVVGYVNGDGSSTLPLAHADGGLQVLTVIETSDAPFSYEYALTLPEGAALILNDDGSVSVESGDGNLLAYVPAPWARDAAGASVPTYYRVQGSSLVQVVQHQGAAYPVVADPFWIPVLKLVAQWSKHALKQIAERNITENLVKIALQEGRRTKGKEKGTSVFEASGIRVVVNDKTGTIITVTRSGGGGSSGGR